MWVVQLADCDKSGDGGVPDGGVPDGGTPSGGVPEGGVPLNAMSPGGGPIGAVPLNIVPSGGVPSGGVPLNVIPPGGGPIGGVPLNVIPPGGVPEGGVPLFVMPCCAVAASDVPDTAWFPPTTLCPGKKPRINPDVAMADTTTSDRMHNVAIARPNCLLCFISCSSILDTCRAGRYPGLDRSRDFL